MTSKKQHSNDERLKQIITDSQSYREQRERGYREQALKMSPHICGWCGREFSGARLKELTVHHKDFDHDNNPPDGSNWELLCLYCHEQMHASKFPQDTAANRRSSSAASQTPFANLKELLNQKDQPPEDASTSTDK